MNCRTRICDVGRPDMVQGGGNDASGIDKAIDRAREWIGQKLM